MTLRLRPAAALIDAFKRGSRECVDAATPQTTKNDAASNDRAPPDANANVRRYTKSELVRVNDASGEHTKELPVELSTSTLECVTNAINEEIAAREGSVWGRHHAKKDKADKEKDAKTGDKDAVGRDGEEGGENATSDGVATESKTATDVADATHKKPTAAAGPMDAEKSKRHLKSAFNKLSPSVAVDKFVEQITECALHELAVAEFLAKTTCERASVDEKNVAVIADAAARLISSGATPSAYITQNGASSTTFKKLLVGALQDEFEGAQEAREGLLAHAERHERDAQAKKVKQRLVGVARLIGELYARGVVSVAVVRAITDELLGEARSVPREDDVEALCALLAVAGAKVDAEAKKAMDAYMARVNVLAESEHLNARTRFACRDVIELRGAGWASSGASADSKSSQADLASESRVVSDELLFPEGPKSRSSGGGGALKGPYSKPGALNATMLPTAANRARLEAEMRRGARERAEAKADAAMAAASGDAGASTSSYTAEQVQQKIASLIDEYSTVGDVNEALMCVADVVARSSDADAARDAVAKALVNFVIDTSTPKAASAVGKLLAALHNRGGFATAVVERAVGDVVAALDDVAIDVPMAPKLMAAVVAAVVASGAVALDFITAAGSGVEDVQFRRAFAGACLNALRVEHKFAGLVKGALNLGDFAKSEDVGDDTVVEWLAKLSLDDLA